MAASCTHSAAPVRVGVLALQGAFREHRLALERLGAEVVEVRRPAHLEGLAGLVLPGGESTVMGKLLVEWDLMEPVRQASKAGLGLLGTCAGLILLCDDIEGSVQPRLGLLDATVQRNAYGRQTDSFELRLDMEGAPDMPAVFIRAPRLVRLGPDVQVLAAVDGVPVAVRQGRVTALAFHPELTGDDRVHGSFLNSLCAG